MNRPQVREEPVSILSPVDKFELTGDKACLMVMEDCCLLEDKGSEHMKDSLLPAVGDVWEL